MLRRIVPVLAVGLVFAACSSGASDESTTAPSTAPAATAPAPADDGTAVLPADVPPILQFSAPLIGGGDIELATLGGRPVLLWFWAPW